MILKAAVRKALRRIGLERIRHPSFANIVAYEGIRTILDVGANDGHFGSEMREQGYRGRIVSFEPIPSVFKKLKPVAQFEATAKLGKFLAAYN